MINRIVYTAGTWDLFHIGHLNLIKESKKLGDYLIVAVSTDELVMSYKGHLPFIPYKERVEIVKSINYVDKVVQQTTLLNILQMQRLHVNILTIGDDWKNKKLEGLEWMKKNEKVIFLPYTESINSSVIRERIKKELI